MFNFGYLSSLVSASALLFLATQTQVRAEPIPLLSPVGSVLPSGGNLLSSKRPGFDYKAQKVRGVNIGGWLVAEPWITPSLFDATNNDKIVDEYTFGQYQDPSAARAALEKHWSTFYTEADFAQIAAAGLNHVRIPVDYWAFDGAAQGEPYVSGSLKYLKQAIGWSTAHGLNVIVDLHGAPGSQNGFDNSGQRLNFPTWHTNDTNIQRTETVMKTMSDMFAGQVPVIEALNEPAGYYGDSVLSAVKKYYESAYSSIKGANPNTLVMIHDAFQEPSYWASNAPQHSGIAFDTHIYQVFVDEDIQRNQDQHIQEACSMKDTLKQYPADMGVVVGEWAPAMTDCAKYLNGRGTGSRWEGNLASSPSSKARGSCQGYSGDAGSFSDDYKTFLRKFWEAQTESYEAGGDGWVQWTWKTEPGAGEEWSYQKGLEKGWIPNDPTQRKYPNLCG